MSNTPPLPKNVTLSRFAINLERMPEGMEIWTLDFPFHSALGAHQKVVQERLKSLGITDYIAIPYRQLNNALVAVCPTLTHGFEFEKVWEGRRALAVGSPSAPAQLPEIEDIRHIIREWAIWWTEQPYMQKIATDERMTLKQKLVSAINDDVPGWAWESVSVDTLLRVFDPAQPLNYGALPSLFATLLHGKTSVIDGKPIRWRKVQEASSKKLSVVGDHPMWTSYYVKDFRKEKEGEGVFAYKLDFSLETQAGRSAPWLFISLHVQRFASAELTETNLPRRISILTGTNKARLDNFPTDTTLTKLQVSEKDGELVWDQNLAEILERVGAYSLQDPKAILDAPTSFWKPTNVDPDYTEDEYYIVHAEGYGYNEAAEGHALETGSSMNEKAEVLEAAVAEHLTMLILDDALIPDKPAPSGQKRPYAMRDHDFIEDKKRNLEPDIVETLLERAFRGEPLQIAILWNSEQTLIGIQQALRKAFLLQDEAPFPENVQIIEREVGKALLESLNTENGGFDRARNRRIQAWKEFLQQSLPNHSNRFAIIELLDKGRSWQVKGAVRAACTQKDITSQMVQTIRMRQDEKGEWTYLKGTGAHRHRAESVAHEVALRHVGGFYGNPHEIYAAAGIEEAGLEVCAIYLHRTNGGITYPIATKIAHDGAVEMLLPHEAKWLLYGNAAPSLGQLFAKEWGSTRYKNGTREIPKWKRNESQLSFGYFELNHFLQRIFQGIQHPTIVIIEAEVWNWGEIWPQLRNSDLTSKSNVLDFAPHGQSHTRKDEEFQNLLGVIRMRTGIRTPQYITDTKREFSQLMGFINSKTGSLMHYFSIGRRLVTAKGQDRPQTRFATMLDEIGAGVPYKYPQVVELVPFFVRGDYQTSEGMAKICRIPHYLRFSPAWPHGNITLPYPMHLAQQLIKDQLCILGMED